MTQTHIIISIIAIISLLVCYVFIHQTIAERQREKQRLHRALEKRAKELIQMVSAFPDNFLPRELLVFIYRCIIDAYEQLSKLKPAEIQYVESLKMHSMQLETVVRKTGSHKVEDLQSLTQINELRQYLNLVGGFLQKSAQRNHITHKQHLHYRQLAKELMIRLAVNNYSASAKQALEVQKNKLAIHYYELAKKLLIKETPTGYKENIQKINLRLEPLREIEGIEAEIKNEASANTDSAASAYEQEQEQEQERERERGEWAGFNKEDTEWKKKNIYD
ncbi:MAG: hypothetical protein ACI9NY_000396 [Kiritimatiellia bacterium]|jgi:hypothetical protein